MKKVIYMVVASVLLLSACSTETPPPEFTNEELVATAVAEIQAEAFSTATPASLQEEAPSTPTVMPEVPAYSPGVPGLHPLDLTVDLNGYGFSCLSPEEKNARILWRCEYTTEEYQYIVSIWGATTEVVDVVEAAAFYYGELDDYSDLTSVIFGQIAALPYHNSAPYQARAWVEGIIPVIQITGDEAQNTFGNVRFYIYALPSSQIMEIGQMP